MKKLSVKIVGILLCAVCALSLLGCNGGGGSADYQKSPAEYAPGTTHIYNVSDSAYRLVSGGTSDYTIVYPRFRDGYGYGARRFRNCALLWRRARARCYPPVRMRSIRVRKKLYPSAPPRR